VTETLENGSFNLVIAVDSMNPELSQTLRYLNECGNAAYSFHALELNRYRSAGTEMLVPRLHGQMSQSRQHTRVGKRQWTEIEYFQTAANSVNAETHARMRDLYDWSLNTADRVFWGRGGERGSFTFHYLRESKTVSVYSVYTDGTLTLNFNYLSAVLDPELVTAFYGRLRQIPSLSTLPERLNGFPSVDLSTCSKQDTVALKSAVIDVLGT
jgi:hypothetical protein